MVINFCPGESVMKILYSDDRIIVCVKPAGVLSTDEPGGLPDLLRQALGDPKATVKTVHRLDRAVGGLMVLARTARAASDLGSQIKDGVFRKEYMAVVHGITADQGRLEDLLLRDKVRRMTTVVTTPGKDAQEAILEYRTLAQNDKFSRVRIRLLTGRTHQIRVQFSSRNWPLVGDKKYSPFAEPCDIALWSCLLAFQHPRTGELMEFELEPPDTYPWNSL